MKRKKGRPAGTALLVGAAQSLTVGILLDPQCSVDFPREFTK